MKNSKLQREIKNFYFLIFVSAFLFFYLPRAAVAAELYIESSKTEYHSGDTFIADLVIDNQNECINAVKADISFSNETLEALDFINGDSVLVFWVENPSVKQEQGLISFAGGVPGGYCGKVSGDSGQGNIIGKIIFKVKGKNNVNSESAEIKFLDTSEVLLNDGKGTKAGLAVRGLSLSIAGSAASVGNEWQKEISGDNIPPEKFAIEVVSDRKIFGGQYFAVFNSSDKQTGIDHYEIRENGGEWIRAESPFLLKDQSLKSLVEIKAVDKAGNERIAEFNPLKPGDKIKNNLSFGTICILIILSGAFIFWIIIKKMIRSPADRK